VEPLLIVTLALLQALPPLFVLLKVEDGLLFSSAGAALRAELLRPILLGNVASIVMEVNVKG
jgi:hypothetical protein